MQRDGRRPGPGRRPPRRPARRQPAYVYRRRRLGVGLAAVALSLGGCSAAQWVTAAVAGGAGTEPAALRSTSSPSATAGSSTAAAPSRTATARSKTPPAGSTTAAGTGASAPAATTRTPDKPASLDPDSVLDPGSVHGGTGVLVPVQLALPPSTQAGREVRYRVAVEKGLGIDATAFAHDVHAILDDARGWRAVDGVRFRLVDHGDVTVTVTLASPEETDRLCAPLLTRGAVSCWQSGRAVINAARWATGSPTYGDDVPNYRRYLINHEVGHGLGHLHVHCPHAGAPAPVMVQQTKSLEGCRANPYPAVTQG